MKTVLIIGSAPDAMDARNFDMSNIDTVVAINNAWRIRDDWDYLVHPEDFPEDRRPIPKAGQKIITAEEYVPSNNAFGGIIYAGATMAFTAAYWALHALKPDILLFSGCNMIYNAPAGRTHFYGKGAPDPLRADPTLQSLEAKANRLMLLAARHGCLCLNIGTLPDSRLTFARIAPDALSTPFEPVHASGLAHLEATFDPLLIDKALAAEAELDCFVESGNYWESGLKINAPALRAIDYMWRAPIKAASAIRNRA